MCVYKFSLSPSLCMCVIILEFIMLRFKVVNISKFKEREKRAFTRMSWSHLNTQLGQVGASARCGRLLPL